MADDFDPYHKWLGIPPKEQPPHRYRLLGLALFEEDADVIESAADQRVAHVRTHQTGKHGPLSQRILNELAQAKLCLLNPESKRDYDEQLKRQLEARQRPQPAPVPAAPRPIAVNQAAATRTSHAAAPGTHSTASISVRRRRPSNAYAAFVAIGATAAVFVGAVLYWHFTAGPQTERKSATPAPEVRRPQVAVARNPVETIERRGEDGDRASTPADESPADEGQGESDLAAEAQPHEAMRAENRDDAIHDGNKNAALPPASESSAATAATAEKLHPTSPAATSIEKPAAKKSAAPRRPKLAPKDAIYHGDNWYWFSDRKGTFQEAQQIANRLKGRLVTITSDDENRFVAEHIKGPTFLGLLKVKGAWLNPSGRPQEYFRWDRGQPSGAKDERFAAIHAGGGWHDYLPDRLFVCIEWGKEP